jgi:hypothetical protein
MKKLIYSFAFGLSSMLLVGQLSVQAQTKGSIEFKVVPPSVPNSSGQQDPCQGKAKFAENLPLSYFRQSEAIVKLLGEIKTAASLSCITIQQVSGDSVVLYGPNDEKDKLKQILALLDLPRPGINMQMWGIQLSSQNSTAMAEAMAKINKEIDKKRELMQRSYKQIEGDVKTLKPESDFQSAITALGYGSLLDNNRPLSLTDILLRFLATDDRQAVANIANNKQFKKLFIDYCEDDSDCLNKLSENPPFRRFLVARGLDYQNEKWSLSKDKTELKRTSQDRLERRLAMLNFALQYRFSQEDPNFNGRKLQASADKFNDILQNAIKDINDDMEELFVEPTLKKIQAIASDMDVSYAQVGKVSVATLNGFKTEVSAKSVSAFNVTPPIKLSELLKNANNISSELNQLVPAAGLTEASPVSPSALVGLIGAFGEQDTKWSDLTSGVSLTMTPNVLRDTTSAELVFTLETGPGDPQAIQDGAESPVSRVEQHKVTSNIYLKTLDLFTFSTFDNQSTKDGGRGYIPIVGKIWQGFFSDLPVVGNLFSWKKDPQNVYHQSVLLANTMITPTAMEVAYLYDLGGEKTCMSIVGSKQELNVGCLDTIFKSYKKVIEQRLSNDNILSPEIPIPEENPLFLNPVP